MTQWFENFDGMFDEGDKFLLRIFTDPIDLQKHLEEQMQHVIEAVSEFESKFPFEKRGYQSNKIE